MLGPFIIDIESTKLSEEDIDVLCESINKCKKVFQI